MGFRRTGVLPILVDWDAVRPSAGACARGDVLARDQPPLRGARRAEQADRGPDQSVLLLPAARPGQPADRRWLGGGHRDLPRRLSEALRRAGPARPRGVRGQRVAGRALHLLPPRVGLPLPLRARGLLRAAPRGHALRRAGRRLRGGGRARHDGRRRPPGPREGLPGDRRAHPPGHPRSRRCGPPSSAGSAPGSGPSTPRRSAPPCASTSRPWPARRRSDDAPPGRGSGSPSWSSATARRSTGAPSTSAVASPRPWRLTTRRGAHHVRARLPHLAERLPAGRRDRQRRPRAPLPRGPAAPGARVRALRRLALRDPAHLLRRGGVGAAARADVPRARRVDPGPRRRPRRLRLLHVPLSPDNARAAAGRPQGGARADRPRRAADLPRSLPEPVPDPARADLPGRGGAGVRRGALPHAHTSRRRSSARGSTRSPTPTRRGSGGSTGSRAPTSSTSAGSTSRRAAGRSSTRSSPGASAPPSR